MKISTLYKTFIFLVISCLSCIHVKEPDLTREVDVFIGVDRGNTFPGAKLPFSMMSVSPACEFPPNDWSWGQWTQGYRSNRPVLGLSHTHTSGAGGGGRYCNILVSAHTGIPEINNLAQSLNREEGQPGYYMMELDEGKIKAETTLTPYVGLHRYTFRESDTAAILINAAFTVHSPTNPILDDLTACKKASVEILSDQMIVGCSEFTGGWGRPADYTVFFAVEFNRPFQTSGCWKNDNMKLGVKKEKMSGVSLNNLGAFVLFSTESDTVIQMKIAVSYKNIEKAMQHLREFSDWDFEKTRTAASKIWHEHLSEIKISVGDAVQRRIFYTSLYHAMFTPRDITKDAPYNFPEDNPQYTDFYCIWDTYRAQNPLLMLIMPERQSDMISSLLDIYTNYGWLPDAWGVGGYLVTQGGSNADVIISEAMQKDIGGFDYELALDAMMKNACKDPPEDGRYSLSYGRYVTPYDTYGYLPLFTLNKVDTFPCAVSRSLEYAYNDYCIALAAKKMEKEETYIEFIKRSEKAMNLYHPVKKLFWAKNDTGEWFPDYDPAHFFHPWTGPYYEGSALQYSMAAPHLIPTLIKAHGGAENFVQFLDTFFENEYYTPTNEPNIHIPWLFIYAGRPDKTAYWIRNLMNRYYSDQSDGLPGDDDSGTMSAWYVWAALGIYAMPGQDIYLMASPAFEKSVINLGNDKKLTITAKNFSEKNMYINDAKINGKPLNRAWFRHHEIINGAEICLVMNDKPNEWGKENLPCLD